MGETIRLSDRLEIRDEPNGNLRLVLATGPGSEYLSAPMGRLFRDALIAACNPPRYDLPTGVIAGSDGKFYAPGDVVPEGWRYYHCEDDEWCEGPARGTWIYEVVEFPPTPNTERVPWWEAVGRKVPDGRPIEAAGDIKGSEPWFRVEGCGSDFVDADGTVEVLLTDTDR